MSFAPSSNILLVRAELNDTADITERIMARQRELFGSMNKQLLGKKIDRYPSQALSSDCCEYSSLWGAKAGHWKKQTGPNWKRSTRCLRKMCCVYQFLIPVTFNDATPYYLLFPPQTRPHPCGQVGAVGLDGRFFLCLESAASLVALSSERSANNSGVMAVVQVERVPCPCDRQPVSDEVKSASQASTNNNA
jgi:hypothetical protein